MNAQTQRTQAVTTEVIDLDQYVEDATTAFQQAVAANRDTSQLRPEHRGALLNELARALRLNPLTKPVIFLKTGQGESIYVTRQGADQIAARLRLNRETVAGPEVRDILGVKVFFCQVKVTAPDGRFETATATLPATDPLMGLMKVETKAKRRATLSIAGLGMLSEEDAEEMGLDAALDRTPPASEPTAALNSLALDLDDCTLNRDAVDLWMKHRAALTADGDGVREEGWNLLVKHVGRLMEVKKTAAEKFIRGEIAARDEETRARRDAAPPKVEPAPESTVTAETTGAPLDPPTLADFRAQLERCLSLNAVADLWRASRGELVEADRAPAWAASIERVAVLTSAPSTQGIGALLKKRIAELDAPQPPPNGPGGGQRTLTTQAPADVAGGCDADVAPTAGAQASANDGPRCEHTAEELAARILRPDAEGDAAWREHLAATVAEKLAAGADPRGALAQGYAKRRFLFTKAGGAALAMARESATVDAMVAHGGDREWNVALIASRCTRSPALGTAVKVAA